MIIAWLAACAQPIDGLRDCTVQEDFVLYGDLQTADVLFVVDGRREMEPVLAELTRDFEGVFLDRLRAHGTDFHIAVVSADVEGPDAGEFVSGHGVYLIRPDRPGAAGAFTAMVEAVSSSAGDAASGTEAMRLALTQGGPFGSSRVFFREGLADLHAVVLSRRDDGPSDAIATPEPFARWFVSLVAPPWSSAFHVHVPGDAAHYRAVSDELGGVVSDVENDGTREFLDAVARRLTRPELVLELGDTPDLSTLRVTVMREDGSDRQAVTDWTWQASRDAVAFEPPFADSGYAVSATYCPQGA